MVEPLHHPRLRQSVALAGASVLILGLAVVAGASERTSAKPGAEVAAPERELPRETANPADAAGAAAGPTPEGPNATKVAAPSVPEAPLKLRRADVLIRGKQSFSPAGVAKLRAAVGQGEALVFDTGVVSVGGQQLAAVGADPEIWRAWTHQSSAEADAVWSSIAEGNAGMAHAASERTRVRLGEHIQVRGERLRVSALVSSGVPNADLVVSENVGAALGLPPHSGMLLSSESLSAEELADSARKIVGSGGDVSLVRPPPAAAAALRGAGAEKLGGFSYTYHPDGTITPEKAWVRANIVTANVPILGKVTCHRVMMSRLNGALAEIQARGLSSSIRSYNGCYVPRFIERNPERPISLHTWGIAIDLNAASNYRGIEGDLDPRVVSIFKKWGFRWGGDWSYTDPMHFELGAG